jgi:hypothetical protein
MVPAALSWDMELQPVGNQSLGNRPLGNQAFGPASLEAENARL